MSIGIKWAVSEEHQVFVYNQGSHKKKETSFRQDSVGSVQLLK